MGTETEGNKVGKLSTPVEGLYGTTARVSDLELQCCDLQNVGRPELG